MHITNMTDPDCVRPVSHSPRCLGIALLCGIAALSFPEVANAQCAANMTTNQCATHDALTADLSSLGSEGLLDAYAFANPNFLDPTEPAFEAGLAVLDLLSGEIHASTRTALIEDSRFAREAAIDRLRDAQAGIGAGEGPALWSRAYGAWGRWQGDGNAARMDRSAGGIFLGGDGLVIDPVRIGVFGGYGRSNLSIVDRASSASIDTWTLGAYAGGQWDAFSLQSGLAYGWHRVAASRSIDINRDSDFHFVDSLSAAYRARTFQAFGEASYDFGAGGTRFEPFANLAHVRLSTNGFTETGGASALTVGSGVLNTTFTTLGIRAGTDVKLGETDSRLHGMVGWRHAFGNVLPTSTHTFATGSNAFTIAGVPVARNTLALELGFDVKLSAGSTLGLSYGGQFGPGLQDHALKAGLNVKF